MSKKKTETPATEKEPKEIVNPQRLIVGVDIVRDGKQIRIEAGLIEAGTLPPAFEARLIERGLLKPGK